MDKCRKCSGSGEFAGGDCFDCGGSGEVNEKRYQTTPAAESKNPALVYEREHKPEKLIPATPAVVEKELAELHKLVKYEAEEAEIAEGVDIWACEHKIGPYGCCLSCGMFMDQFIVHGSPKNQLERSLVGNP